jgi:hypothetical protein
MLVGKLIWIWIIVGILITVMIWIIVGILLAKWKIKRILGVEIFIGIHFTQKK